MYLIFDIGGSSTKLALFDKEGNILIKKKSQSKKTYQEFLSNLEHWYDYFSKAYPIEKISFSSPGIIDTINKKSSGLTALGYLDRDFIGDMSKYCKLDRDNFFIENDANCGALAELFFDKKIRDFAYFAVGTGLGGAVVIDRKIHRGISNKAGEFGYAYSINTSDNLSKLATLPNVKARLLKDKNIDISTYKIFDYYLEGKDPYYTYVKKANTELVKAMYNIKYILDPEYFIIGGAISSDQRYIASLQKISKNVCFKGAEIKIKASTNKNDNNLYGAFYNIDGVKK
ncbi:MAG: ROK family protein [Peptoniphilaceae bacterium]|nr:ROK family protein [Peptoniphilaceae bacterium]MDY6019257.1 ROK family protein [Anaerococcus sp.]